MVQGAVGTLVGADRKPMDVPRNLPRIISLLPAATELVCAAGLADFLVGVSHECDFPPRVQSLPKLTRAKISAAMSSGEIDLAVKDQLSGGEALYRIDEPSLVELAPNLIVTQGLCDVCAISTSDVVRAAARISGSVQVVELNPTGVSDIFSAIERLASIGGTVEVARSTIGSLKERIARVRQQAAGQRRRQVLLLEWLDPPFSAGHWNPELIELAGGHSLLAAAGRASREIGWSEIEKCGADVVVVAGCGLSLDRTRQDWIQVSQSKRLERLPAFQTGEIWAVDGSQFFNRPGPRLIDSLEILARILFSDGPYSGTSLEPYVRRISNRPRPRDVVSP